MDLLWFLVIILVVLWALGFFGGVAASMGIGGLVHILLVIAVIIILVRLLRGERV